MAVSAAESLSGWKYESMLGSGGFGAVYLYRNEVG